MGFCPPGPLQLLLPPRQGKSKAQEEGGFPGDRPTEASPRHPPVPLCWLSLLLDSKVADHPPAQVFIPTTGMV